MYFEGKLPNLMTVDFPAIYIYGIFNTKYRAGNFTNTDSNTNPYRYMHMVAIIYFHIRTWTKPLSTNLNVLILYGLLASTNP